MAVLIATHLPIVAVSTISGNQERIQNIPEHSGETFPAGSVVALDASGYVIPWGGTGGGVAACLCGIAYTAGQNLATTSGLGTAPTFGSIGFPGGPTYGSVQNQASAVNVLHGAPFQTGETLIALSVEDTIFEAQTDASTGATYNPTIALVGTEMGLTIDAGGHFYLDLAKVTPAANTVVKLLSINPQDLVAGSFVTGINNARMRFKFLNSASQVG